MNTITMYDSVNIDTIPSNPQAVAGYVGGSWPTYSLLVKRFPRALHKSIAVNAQEDADILDIETGDAVPSEAPAWVRRQQGRGVKQPGLYANASTMPAVVAAIGAAGIGRDEVILWVAHFTGVRPNPPYEQGADGVQFTDHALGRSLDESACVPGFFHTVVPVKNTTHYEWFSAGPFSSPWGDIDERKVVERYDGARKHRIRYHFYLRKLRKQLKFLADRVAAIAIKDELVNGKPSWNKFHRGWRFQQLVHRAQGQRFV